MDSAENGRFLATASLDGLVRLWEPWTGECTQRFCGVTLCPSQGLQCEIAQAVSSLLPPVKTTASSSGNHPTNQSAIPSFQL
jgi:hypothetical protein